MITLVLLGAYAMLLLLALAAFVGALVAFACVLRRPTPDAAVVLFCCCALVMLIVRSL